MNPQRTLPQLGLKESWAGTGHNIVFDLTRAKSRKMEEFAKTFNWIVNLDAIKNGGLKLAEPLFPLLEAACSKDIVGYDDLCRRKPDNPFHISSIGPSQKPQG
jgi:hypothetical protein